MSTHFYKYTYEHSIICTSSKDWTNLILRFTKLITMIVSLSTKTSLTTEKIISHKYDTHIKYEIYILVYLFHK
jgi:hypothetical protein